MNQYGQKRTWATGGLIILNIVYFLYLEIAGSSENTLFMLQHGAMFPPLILQKGEYYRLLTSVFMHFGINHIANNMLMLFIMGDRLERALGSVRYLVFYLVCGVGANVVSMFLSMRDLDMAVSAGASGAIFGVIGGLLYVVIANKGRLEDLSTMQLVLMTALSLYFGLASTGVDNAAHISGLVIGLLLAPLLYRKPKKPKQPQQSMWDVEEERGA